MHKGIFFSLLFCLSGGFIFAQGDTLPPPQPQGMPTEPPAQGVKTSLYRIKPGVDIPLTAVAAGWSGFAFTKVYSKDAIPEATVRSLKISDINGFDRWGAYVYSDKADKISDIPFYVAMPLPLVLMADHKVRQNGWKVAFLYLEAMSLTGLLYTGATFLVDRYRPYTYNDKLPMYERTAGGSKNSFFAGHVALVGTSTFFVAKVYADHHPDSKVLKHVFYGTAIATTAATGYLRHKAGKHFPSDIALGLAVGSLSGILVPHLHKNKAVKDPAFSLTPYTTGKTQGLAMVYRIK